MMAAGVGALLATAAAAPAQTQTKYETYTATAANLSAGSGQALRINVFRWSTDDERQKALSAVGEKGDKGLPDALASAPSAGYLWTGEPLGYTLRYAYKQPLPAGGERVILLTDRRLGSWSRVPWMAADAGDEAFTLIELRLNRAGIGEGKMSFATRVAADQTAGTIALDHYDTAPVLLKNVKHEPRRNSPR
jgi:hypothetical protein